MRGREYRKIPEMRLAGDAAGHGFVVGVEVGVVVDLEEGGGECGGEF